MKQSEIIQKLGSKSRDELNIIAKKLKIKNRHKLKNEELISSILQKNPKEIASILHVTWWDKYHNHVYGISGIISLILAVIFSPLIFDTNNSNIENLSKSESYVKATIALENNIFETYLFDNPYNLKLILQNESDFNWYDIDINIFTLFFLNEEPCLSEGKGPFINKLVKNIPFLGKGKVYELNIGFFGDYFHLPQLDNIVVDKIKIRDGLLNPFLFSKTFDKKETLVKLSTIPTKIENKLFNQALFDLLDQKSELPILFNLMQNVKNKFGGFIDFVQVTGTSRGNDQEVKFLKLFPVFNMWFSNIEKIQFAHNFLLINTIWDSQTEYVIKDDSLIRGKSETILINSSPKEDEIKRRLESEKKVVVDFTRIAIGLGLQNINIDGIMLSSADEKDFKSLKTIKFNTEAVYPGFATPKEIKFKPCK